MEVKKFTENANRSSYRLAQDSKYAGDEYWDWSIWVEASDKDLDKIEYVTYNLHFSFPEPVQIKKNRQNKFKLETSGWGTFTIYARITFKDQTIMQLEHELELSYKEEGKDAPLKTEEPGKEDKPEKKPKKR